MAERINLGKIMVTLEGEWDSSIAYDKYCEVSYNGSSYVSTKSVPVGTLPTNTEYWQQRASKGTDGQDGIDGTDGLDAYQPFKGWYNSSSALSTAVSSPQVGDYAYVKGATASDPTTIYECTTTGTWSMSQREFNPANNQEFASGESLNTTNIVDSLTSSSPTDVLSAKQGKVLKEGLDELGLELVEKVGLDKSVNEFDKDSHVYETQGYWSNGSGWKASAGFHVTKPYYLKQGTIVRTTTITGFGTTYVAAKVNADNTYISRFSGTSTDGHLSFTIPSDGYYSFNMGNAANSISTFMITFDAAYPESYEAFFKAIEEGIDLNDKQKAYVASQIGDKADLVTVKSKNLFNPADIIVDKHFNYWAASLATYSGGCVSGLIPIEAGKTYTLSRPNVTHITDATINCLNASGSSTKAIDPSTGEIFTNANLTAKKVVTFIAPANSTHLRFNIAYSNYAPSFLEGIQLEEGSTATEYEEYFEPKQVVDGEQVNYWIEQAGGGGSTEEAKETISIANSEKIGFFSNSFLNGYTMNGKNAIQNLSMYSDYIMYNYGHSGDDMLELLARINTNNAWLGAIGVRDWGIKYGVIAMQDNDGALLAANANTYYHNGKNLAEAIKSMGGIPILSTEHDQAYDYYAFSRLAQEEGYMLMDWGRKAAYLSPATRFVQFWHSGHPATRTAWLWTNGMKPYLDTLPRPEKAIKLFRVRETPSDIDELMYDTILSRAERFAELYVGASVLTDASNKKFDREATGSYESQTDEYQEIQAGQSVSFDGYALVEVITPYDRNSLKTFALSITGSGIEHIYCRKVSELSDPLPSQRYVAFGVVSGAELLTEGTTFTISGITREDGTGLNATYEVEGVVNGICVTKTTSSSSSPYKSSGTDIGFSCSISGVEMAGTYDYPTAEYMTRYAQPLGEWVEVTATDGVVTLSAAQIKLFTQFDKIAFLLTGTAISLSGISATVSGTTRKRNDGKPMVEYKAGTSLLTATTFTASDTAWDGIDGLDDYVPITSTDGTKTEVLPVGFSNCKVIANGESVKQAITTPQTNDFKPTRLQLRVIARYFPKYIKTDADWDSTEVTPTTYDCAKLKVGIMRSSTSTNVMSVAEIHVGAWWNQYIVEFDYYGYFTHLMLECVGKSVQILQCELVQI